MLVNMVIITIQQIKLVILVIILAHGVGMLILAELIVIMLMLIEVI